MDSMETEGPPTEVKVSPEEHSMPKKAQISPANASSMSCRGGVGSQGEESRVRGRSQESEGGVRSQREESGVSGRSQESEGGVRSQGEESGVRGRSRGAT